MKLEHLSANSKIDILATNETKINSSNCNQETKYTRIQIGQKKAQTGRWRGKVFMENIILIISNVKISTAGKLNLFL